MFVSDNYTTILTKLPFKKKFYTEPYTQDFFSSYLTIGPNKLECLIVRERNKRFERCSTLEFAAGLIHKH
jgi:hypothetical protein